MSHPSLDSASAPWQRPQGTVQEMLLKTGLVPDQLIRFKIRSLLRDRLASFPPAYSEAWGSYEQAFIEQVTAAPLAVMTQEANLQHYEVPAAFFHRVLGKRMKYSSGLWSDPNWSARDIDRSEESMLDVTLQRANIGPGQRVLELGCGWGSFILYAAERFRTSSFVGISNSRDQKQWIDRRCQELGLTNVEIMTLNMAEADLSSYVANRGGFDRVVSVEMFEHMRNHQLLLQRIAAWMNPGATLFVHIFVHAHTPYLFEEQDQSDWMSRYFFSGGMMPSYHYLCRFQQDLQLTQSWAVNGTHYQKTSEAWLQRMDQNRAELLPLFLDHYRELDAQLWWQYWRIFFMACAELWGYRQGREWFVGHYLFSKKLKS